MATLFYFSIWYSHLYAHHGFGDMLSTVLDKATISAIMLYGGYVFFTKLKGVSDLFKMLLAAVVLATFFGTLYLYLYGEVVACGAP